MDISEFYDKIFKIIDGLESTELIDIHNHFYEKGCYETLNLSIDTKNITQVKEAIKKGIQKISLEDLDSFSPIKIKEVIKEFTNPDETDEYDTETQNIIQSSHEETQESLTKEAINIGSQRQNDRQEIPRDLQKRLGYIIAKLNVKYRVSRRDLAKLINLNRNTINEYTNQCLNSQPDLVQMWSQSIENKTIQGTEETIGKQATGRAISILKDSITLGDNIREKYAVVAAQKGYNLYNKGDLETLINRAVNLYFESESVYLGIVQLENERMRLYNQVADLKKQNLELNRVLLINDFE